MEDAGRSCFTTWIQGSDPVVTPSLLASILLSVNKAPHGLSDLLELLTDSWASLETDVQRVQCTELLAKTLGPSLTTVSTGTVNDLLEFMSNTCTKDEQIALWIDILHQLIETGVCSPKQCLTITQWLFDQVPSKKWPQPTRHKVLTILGHMIQSKARQIEASSLNFIDGYISIMDGEKDPRNLLLAFDLVRLIIDKFDISRHVEDLFDIIFCYFPISFSPPPNDPLAITSDELKLSLRRCLAATPYFAYYSTPVLIEKLLSSSGSVKKDVMDTIRLCAPSYGAHALLPHAHDLFGALVKEIYQGSDVSMSSLALDTIHHVVATLATGVSIVNIRDPAERAIGALLQEALEHLKTPELRHAKSASAILRAAASASDPACTLVVNAVVPLLYDEFRLTDPIGRQKAVLGYLIDLLEANAALYGTIDSDQKDRDLQTPLTAHKQRLFQTFVTSFIHDQRADTELHYLYFTGIRLMVIMKRFLTAEEIDLTVMQLARQLFYPDKSVRALVCATLAGLAKPYPQTLQRYAIPMLLDQLQSRQRQFQEVLPLIQAIAVESSVFCTVAERLWGELATAAKHRDTLSYAHGLALCVKQLMSEITVTEQVARLYQSVFFPGILREAVKAALYQPDSWLMNQPLLHVLSSIIAVTVRTASDTVQKDMVAQAFYIFVQGDLAAVRLLSTDKTEFTLFGTCSMSPSDEPMDQCDRDMTMLFPAIIGNCKKEIALPLPDVYAFLDRLIRTVVDTACPARQWAMNASVAVIANKWMDDTMARHLMDAIHAYLSPVLENAKANPASRRSALQCLIWVTKGLVVRGHALGLDLVNELLHICRVDDVLNMDAAQGMAVLLHQDEMILHRASHAVVSILYRQRLFHHCLPKLTVDHNHACLVALSHLLVNIPSQVPVADMPKLIPSLVMAFESSDEQLILTMIRVAKAIGPLALREPEYIRTMVDRLLPLTHVSDRAAIRLNALQCLTAFAQMDWRHQGLDNAFVHHVIKALGPALDDKKRRVRKEAVDCREQWYKLTKV
ncbi:Dos2-interacting transcription regulator of RNA-Pol-II-domain-containing protein [Gongronella butleri]|nr:Dos2-interacting transcription regulator of RNA-Pol-II-domain-containing protein [Gongronella butleri]